MPEDLHVMIADIHVPLDELVRYRRHFHMHPELSLREFETAAYVERELRALELDEIRTGIGKTGVLGTLRGGKPGPVTLLRADIDALPVTETADVDYKSQNTGVMHACGHDAHIAILLSAAKELARRRAEVPGTLVFCFQPGEEGYAGNKLMIEEGALENPHVDRCFALHVFSGYTPERSACATARSSHRPMSSISRFAEKAGTARCPSAQSIRLWPARISLRCCKPS